ncbi:MAG: hypothetical protein ACYS7Y_35980 [Planctomycetota bacterium]|jgi:hypothetical protein
MAANTWNNSQANNDGNDPLNWSLGHVPTTGETATWDATSTDDCNIASAYITCLDINVATAYSGLITVSNSKQLQLATGGSSSIDGRVALGNAFAILYGVSSHAFSLGANAQITGTGYIFCNQSTAGITSNAGATVTCDRIFYQMPRLGCSLAAGTYGCDLHVEGHGSLASYSDFAFGAGSHQYESVKWTSPGTAALQVDAATNNPSITITGDLTIDIDSTGGIVLDASSNAITLQGNLIDEIVGGGSFDPDSQDLTLSGTANQNIDGCGGTWGTVQIAKNSGTATLTDTLTCANLVQTKGGLDLNGQTLTASGTVAVTSVLGGVTIEDLTGSTINCNEFSDSGIDLIGSATWYLNCTTSGTIANATITNCDASGGVEVDARGGG